MFNFLYSRETEEIKGRRRYLGNTNVPHFNAISFAENEQNESSNREHRNKDENKKDHDSGKKEVKPRSKNIDQQQNEISQKH